MSATVYVQMRGRDVAQILAALLKQATPGTWASFDGHVSAVDVPSESVESRNMRDDPQTLEAYGGLLVCESCHNPDAALIAATKNLVPKLIEAFYNALEDAEHFKRRLDRAEAKATDAEHLVDLIRSQRYQPLQYPPAHVLGVRYHRHEFWGWPADEAAD